MADAAEPVTMTVQTVDSPTATTRVTHVASNAAPNDASSAEADAASDRPTFVLVGGLGVAATYFEFLAPTLAERGDVYALDLPGFAGMAKPAERPSAAFFADQVENVIDRLGLNNPVLIGHSMGTQVVTEVLCRRPELTHAVLVSPVVDETEATVVTQAVRFLQSATHESLHLAMTALSAYVLCGTAYFARVLPLMLRYRMSDRVRDVSAKLLLIRGEFDHSSPRRFHSRLVAGAPAAWRWEIEGAAHSIINGHAIGVARLTVRHLDGELARRGRMPAADAELPPAPNADLPLLLHAVRTRAVEWMSALRGDERGVAKAKAEHAQLVAEAYEGAEDELRDR